MLAKPSVQRRPQQHKRPSFLLKLRGARPGEAQRTCERACTFWTLIEMMQGDGGCSRAHTAANLAFRETQRQRRTRMPASSGVMLVPCFQIIPRMLVRSIPPPQVSA